MKSFIKTILVLVTFAAVIQFSPAIENFILTQRTVLYLTIEDSKLNSVEVPLWKPVILWILDHAYGILIVGTFIATALLTKSISRTGY